MKSVAYPVAVVVALVPLLMGAPSAADGDAAKGEIAFNRCKMCHTLIEGPKKIGPHLRNLFGREAGSVPAFKYSKAMLASDVVWDEETLDQFIEKPGKLIRKNQMMFNGMRNDGQRQDLIEYLKRETAK